MKAYTFVAGDLHKVEVRSHGARFVFARVQGCALCERQTNMGEVIGHVQLDKPLADYVVLQYDCGCTTEGNA